MSQHTSQSFKGKIIQGETSGAIAKVITTVAQTSTDPYINSQIFTRGFRWFFYSSNAS